MYKEFPFQTGKFFTVIVRVVIADPYTRSEYGFGVSYNTYLS